VVRRRSITFYSPLPRGIAHCCTSITSQGMRNCFRVTVGGEDNPVSVTDNSKSECTEKQVLLNFRFSRRCRSCEIWRCIVWQKFSNVTEMSTRNFPGSKGRLAHKADNLTAICEHRTTREIIVLMFRLSYPL
jgi:hypothetical protein